LKNVTAAVSFLILFSLSALAEDKKPDTQAAPAATATPAAPAAPQSSAKVSEGDYTVPVYFEPKPNGINVLDQALEYHLKGNELTIGKMNFNSTTIKYELHKDKDHEGNYVIKFSWPKGFLTQGKLLMRTNVEKKTMFSLDKLPQGSFDGDTFSIESTISEKDVQAWDKQTPLKFCVDDSDNKKSFCSQDYIIKDVYEGVNLRVSREEFHPGVNLDNQDQPTQGKYHIKYGSNMVGKITFKNGAEFNFETTPVPFEALDIIEDNENKILFKAKGGLPIGGGPEAESWIARLEKDKPYFYLNTKNDIMLMEELEMTRPAPPEKVRPHLKKGSRDSSYWTHVPLHGYDSDSVKVSSQEFNAENTGDHTFDWDFQDTTRGTVNRSHIKLLDNDKEYVGYYEVYKGYPVELSGRFTGAFSGNGAIILGEVLATGWLEQFFKSENTILSLQRWGASVRYLASLSAPTDTNGNQMNLTSLNADLKYRFTPGIWNQDESLGLMAAYQSLTFESASATMAGVGAFWVRPMPSLVDKVLNKVKWFRYPKVIDAEIEYFPMSLTSGTTLGTNINAIVHGKLFLKPTFFIEGAVGVKEYSYSQTNNFQANITTAFFSGGIGLDF
jgi:hypothetical protein